jgi:hypothetical protein
MPRGGKRSGAGAKPSWKLGKTRTIRVPIKLADKILKIARQLDEMGMIEIETRTKILDLSEINVCQIRGESVVRLKDLQAAGYKIQSPQSIELIEESELIEPSG